MQINQADLGGAESFLFEVMGQPANGARACRLNRHQDRRVHALTFHQAGDLAGSAFVLPRRHASEDGVMVIGHRADESLISQLMQALQGEANVEVLLKPRTVKVDRVVGHDNVFRSGIARNDSVAGLPLEKTLSSRFCSAAVDRMETRRWDSGLPFTKGVASKTGTCILLISSRSPAGMSSNLAMSLSSFQPPLGIDAAYPHKVAFLGIHPTLIVESKALSDAVLGRTTGLTPSHLSCQADGLAILDQVMIAARLTQARWVRPLDRQEGFLPRQFLSGLPDFHSR